MHERGFRDCDYHGHRFAQYVYWNRLYIGCSKRNREIDLPVNRLFPLSVH